MMELQAITRAEELERLAPEWSSLWERCPAATPFQTPEWLLPWWRVFGHGRLATAAVWSAGRLAGLAPLFIDGRETLRFLGAGISDYLDFLVEPGTAAAATSRLLDHLARSGGGWIRCELEDIPPWSPLLTASSPDDLRSTVEAAAVCPVLRVGGSVEKWLATLPTGLRRNIRRCREHLAGWADARMETAGPENLAEYLDALFRLHGEWWRRRGGPGVLAGPGIREFHERAAAGLLARGCLRFYGLRTRSGLGAVLYSLACRGRAYLYLSGFDPALARFSPGTLLVAHAIEEAIRAGLAEIDFLRGNEGYKYRWGARDRPNHRWLAWPRQSSGGGASLK